MKAIVVDDEQAARENLIYKLGRLGQKIEIVGEAENIDDAENLIKALHPDMIFLDISIPNGSGFDLLDRFEKIDFEIIFITAHNEYALKAFQYFAIGYLLKPLDIDILKETVEKTINRIENNHNKENIFQLSKFLKESQWNPKLAIPVESGLEFVDSEKIVKISASDGYSTIELEGGKSMLSSKPLSYYATLLDQSLFFQIHRAYIINLSFIEKYHKVGFVQLADGTELPVAKSKRMEFLNMFRAK